MEVNDAVQVSCTYLTHLGDLHEQEGIITGVSDKGQKDEVLLVALPALNVVWPFHPEDLMKQEEK